jgi:Xaa-Pro aminopeptidase
MDFGATVNGYHSDMTRTVCIGKADEEMKKLYNTVLSAQLAALDYLMAGGVNTKEADKVARDIIAAAGYGENFGHSLGHGVGLEIHENPSFSPKSTGMVRNGNVLSVEPGIYIEVASKVLQFGPGKVYGKVEHVVHIYIGRYNLLGCKI